MLGKIFRTVGKLLLAIAAVIVIVLVGLYASDPTYFGRIYALPFTDIVRDVSYYEPREVVPGNPAPALKRAAEGERTISAAGWQEALDYAKAMDSLALVAWRNGAIEYEYYKDGFKPEDQTDPASMHKSVVALVVGAAIADGFIASVDDPVAKYVPEWAKDDRRAITIRHLLQMSSGLARAPFSLSPFSVTLRLNVGTEIRDLTLGVKAGKPPGTEFSYDSFNPQTLGIVIENATGKRYADYLSERIWKRLGTRNAHVVPDHAGGLARTYCCLHASAEDWVRVGLLYLNDGRVGEDQVIPAEWMRAVTTPSPTNPNYGYLTWLGTTYEPVRSYGAGVPIGVPHSAPFAAKDVIYFDGAGGQRLYVMPSLNLIAVRTGAGGTDFQKQQFKWDDAIIPNALIRGISGGR